MRLCSACPAACWGVAHGAATVGVRSLTWRSASSRWTVGPKSMEALQLPANVGLLSPNSQPEAKRRKVVKDGYVANEHTVSLPSSVYNRAHYFHKDKIVGWPAYTRAVLSVALPAKALLWAMQICAGLGKDVAESFIAACQSRGEGSLVERFKPYLEALSNVPAVGTIDERPFLGQASAKEAKLASVFVKSVPPHAGNGADEEQQAEELGAYEQLSDDLSVYGLSVEEFCKTARPRMDELLAQLAAE